MVDAFSTLILNLLIDLTNDERIQDIPLIESMSTGYCYFPTTTYDSTEGQEYI